MAAASAAMILTCVRAPVYSLPQCEGLVPMRMSKRNQIVSRSRIVMSASPRTTPAAEEKGDNSALVAQLTALALATSTVLPEIADASITPSLKNLLLSVAAGFGVLFAIIVAVLGFATFDPIKRS